MPPLGNLRKDYVPNLFIDLVLPNESLADLPVEPFKQAVEVLAALPRLQV
jgi:hypothetical protein